MDYRLRPSEWVMLVVALACAALVLWGLYEAGSVLVREAALLTDRP